MKKLLLEMLEGSGELDLQSIVLRLVAATLIAVFIYISYMLSHEGSIYSKKFNVSLMALTVIKMCIRDRGGKAAFYASLSWHRAASPQLDSTRPAFEHDAG